MCVGPYGSAKNPRMDLVKHLKFLSQESKVLRLSCEFDSCMILDEKMRKASTLNNGHMFVGSYSCGQLGGTKKKYCTSSWFLDTPSLREGSISGDGRMTRNTDH